MVLRTLVLYASLIFAVSSQAQRGTLYDDTRLSSVHIALPADSLEILYDSILSDHYYLARFVFDDTEQCDTLENVGFRLRGNTSRYSLKKSFKISFNEYVPGRKYQGVKKLNLNGQHNDPTMIREKLFYDLWKRAGFPERRTSFVRVYINGDYYGLYTNIEELDKEWLKRHYADPGGNLYKCTYPADLVYHGPLEQTYKDLMNGTATGGRVYDLQTNEEEDDYSGLVSLIGGLNQPVTGNFSVEIASLLGVDRFLKALALDVATGNWDDYSYNKNNFYLYEDPASGRTDFITYDPDNTFGIDWFGIDWGRRDYRYWVNDQMPLPLAKKLLAVPAFMERYTRYIDTMARQVINPGEIFPRIASLKSLIRDAAVEDTWRTLDYGYSVADFDNSFTQPIDSHTPYGLMPFISTRQKSLLDQLKTEGLAGSGPGSGRMTLYPNPAGLRISILLDRTPARELPARITDLQGRTLRVMNLRDKCTVISLEGLSSGVFILEADIDGQTVLEKFIHKP